MHEHEKLTEEDVRAVFDLIANATTIDQLKSIREGYKERMGFGFSSALIQRKNEIRLDAIERRLGMFEADNHGLV